MGTDTFSQIECGAHIGAMGNNPLQEPTVAQQIAGNYKMGRITLHGLDIAIENPRGTFRSGVNKKTGKAWSNRMAAHYGYLTGTKGADGDGLDVFVGHVPESKRVFVINQINPESGQFDEHKLMIGFDDYEQAKSAYQFSYERGWDGIGSMIETTLSQIKWWAKHGDMKSPLSTSALPREGYEDMDGIKWTSGNDGGFPIGSSLDTVLYKIRQSDHGEGLVFDSLTLSDILDDADERITLDALVIPFAQLGRRMNVLMEVMARAGGEVKPLSMQISEPFKQRGVANVAAVFELSDGQTIAAFFHNPDVNPSKLSSGDEMISWKWMLNKKDITIIAAPEKGADLNVREVARRVMRLAEKNSASFQRVNARRSERMASIATLKESVANKETLLTQLQSDLQVKRAAKEKALALKAQRDFSVREGAKEIQDISRYAIGKSKKNTITVSKIGVVEGENVYECDMANNGTGTHTKGFIHDVMGWLGDMMFVGGGASIGKVRSALKWASGSDILGVRSTAVSVQENMPVSESDITYRATDDMFTMFFANTPAGEVAWRKIAEHTDGTGKVMHAHVESTVQQLRDAGYTVSKDRGTRVGNEDELLAELTGADPAPSVTTESDENLTVNGTFGDLSLAEKLTAKGILFVERDGIFFLGKTNKATGNTVCMQYTNNKQVTNAIEKLRVAGFEVHGTAQHPFRIVITASSSVITVADVAKINAGFANPPSAVKTFPDLDPTGALGYAEVKDDDALLLKWQDRLDDFFQARLSSIRNALYSIGWGGVRDKSGSLQKKGYEAKFVFKHIGAGNNVVGYYVQLKDGADIQAEVGDNLTRTIDEQVMAINDVFFADEAAAHKNDMAPVVVAGDELGDFPDTAEGKKELRTIAAEAYKELMAAGAWVHCPSLGADVELRTKGLKKVISQSGDARKLKIIPHLKSLIAQCKKVGDEKPNYDKANSPNIVGYQTMRALVNIGAESLAVRFVFGRDDKGSYHYDQTIHPLEAVFDSVNENELARTSSNGSMGGNLGCTCDRCIASEPCSLLSTNSSVEHRTSSILEDAQKESKRAFDSVADSGINNREVINLFIEGEEVEVVSDEPETLIDPVAAMIAQVVQDPIEHEAWTLPKEKIEAMSPANYDEIYAKLEDENFHSENLVLQAARIGTDAQYQEARALLKHINTPNDNGISVDDYRRRRGALIDAFYKIRKGLGESFIAQKEEEELAARAASAPNAIPASEFKDDEQVNYKPFNVSTVKMPTAQQLGIGVASKGILRLFKDANDAQVDGWTNGHILDVFSEPPLIADAKKAIEEGSSGSVGWIDYSRVEQIVNKSKAGVIALSPVGAYECIADEASKRYSAIAALQGKSPVDIKSVILGNEAENLALHVNKFYFAYFVRTYKGAEFFTDKDGGNVLVKHRDKIVGVLMPVKLKGAATTPQDYAENLARAKYASFKAEEDKRAAITVENSKHPPTDIKIGDMVRKDGEDFEVTGAIDGGISAKRVASQDDGILVERTIFLIGDDAIGARIDYQNNQTQNASASSSQPHTETTLSSASPLDLFEADGGETWQVTRAKWVEIMRGHMASLGQAGEDSDFEGYHQSQVKQALDAGKGIPAEVLADYPDMKAETPEQKEVRYAQAEANLARVLNAAAGVPTQPVPKPIDPEPEIVGDSDLEAGEAKSDAETVESPLDRSEAQAGNDPVQQDPVHDLPHADESNVPLANAVDHSADITFMQSVIDGKADIWDSGLAGKLEAILGRVSGDQALHAMWLKALKSYSSQALTFTQKTLSG